MSTPEAEDPTPTAPPETGPDDDPAEAEDVDELEAEDPAVDNMVPPDELTPTPTTDEEAYDG
jgi:hypothetical protein